MSALIAYAATSKEGHPVHVMEPDDQFLFDPMPVTSEPDRRPEPATALPVLVTRTGAPVEAYEREYVEPVRRLQATLSDVLDVDANPERDPDEALSMLKDAMETFNEESANWL